MSTFTPTGTTKSLSMKTIAYNLLVVIMVGGTTTQAQKTRPYNSEGITFVNFVASSKYTSPTQLRIKVLCKRKVLTFQVMGLFRIKKEYLSPTDFMHVKYFLLNIHPFKIYTKQKFL